METIFPTSMAAMAESLLVTLIWLIDPRAAKSFTSDNVLQDNDSDLAGKVITDTDDIGRLNASTIGPGEGRITPLLAAAKAGDRQTALFLTNNGADVSARDSDGDTIVKILLDSGLTDIAQLIVDRNPGLLVTDPRLPKGDAWLREQFILVSSHIRNSWDKPSPALLERLISGNLGPIEGRSVSDIYWEHIFLRYIGDVKLDIRRNYAMDVQISLLGTFRRVLVGHEGIRESAHLLNSVLPTTEYEMLNTVIDNDGGWVTERWGYHDSQTGIRVSEGIDSFIIRDCKIRVMMINYTVETAPTESTTKELR